MPAKSYVRLKARVGADARVVTVWAIDLGVGRKGMRTFAVVAKDGERKDRLIMGRDGSSDFIEIRPARMNLHYAELELVDASTAEGIAREGKTWIEEDGAEAGVCTHCGDRCSTHADASDPLVFCADCDAVTCGCCTSYGTGTTPRCPTCATKHAPTPPETI